MANYQLEYTGNQVAEILASVADKLDTEDFETFQTALTALLAQKAPLASPALTGVPTVPTAAANTNTTQAASTGFVLGQKGTASPMMDGTAAVGASILYARQDHVHPSDTSRAPLASPALTGVPTAPTAAVGTNNTQLATTAFVLAQILASLGFKVLYGTSSAGPGVTTVNFSTAFSTTPQVFLSARSTTNYAIFASHKYSVSTSLFQYTGYYITNGGSMSILQGAIFDWLAIGT